MLVTNYDVLTAAIAKYEELTAEPEQPPVDDNPTVTPPEDEDPVQEPHNEKEPEGSDDDPEPAVKKGCGKTLGSGAAVLLLGAAWVALTARKKQD